MKLANTLIALVIVGLLGGVLFYLTKHPTTKASPDANAKKKLFSFQPDQVKEFTIEAPDQPAATFRRVADEKAAKAPAAGLEAAGKSHWEVVSPAGVAADASQVQSFLDGLPRIEYTPVEEQTPASLAEYGLDQPRKTVKFQLAQGQPVTLIIGKENPGGIAKYGMLSSMPGLFLLDSSDARDIDKSLLDLRDKRVVPASLDKATRLQLKFDSSAREPAAEKDNKENPPARPPQIVMVKQPDGNWQMTDPPLRTDVGGTTYLSSTIGGAQMSSVEAENPKSLSAYGLDRPQIRVEVTTPDGAHSLLVGKKKVAEKKPGEADKKEEVLGYYAKNSDWPVVFTITQTFYDVLNQGLDSYRSRFLFNFDTPSARRLEVQGPEGGELRFDKKGEDWFKAGATPTKVDATKVNAFLNAVHDLRTEKYPEDRPGRLSEYGLEKPWMKVKVTFGESNKEETVLFSLKNKKFYAARQDAPSIYELPSNSPETLLPLFKDISS